MSIEVISPDKEDATKIASVLSNKKCQSILQLLAKKAHTETQISESLSLPLPTVHYNMK